MPLLPTPGFFQKKSELYKQLGQMLSNGIPPAQAFKTFSTLGHSSKVRNDFLRKVELIENGESFENALFVGSFPAKEKLDKSLINAGEKSGRVVESLDFLDRYYQAVARIYKVVIKRLTYPFLVIHAAATVMAIVAWVLSKFDSVVAIQQFCSIIIPLYLIIAIVLFITFHNKLPIIRNIFEAIFSFIPILNKALKSLHITRFTLALDSMLTAGLHVKESLQLASSTSGSLRLQSRIDKYLSRLEAGESISSVLDYCKFFPQSYTVAIAVAEQSGRIDETLETLYKQYLEDSEDRLKKFGGAFSGAIYFAFVIFMIISIFSIFKAYIGQLDGILGG